MVLASLLAPPLLCWLAHARPPLPHAPGRPPALVASPSLARAATPPPMMARTITDEARDTIIELVQVDVELIAEQMQQKNTKAAWEMAQSSFEKRWPIIEWTLRYNVDRAALNAVEAATNCTLFKRLSPKGHSELHWQRSHLISRLAEQRSRLANALFALHGTLLRRRSFICCMLLTLP